MATNRRLRKVAAEAAGNSTSKRGLTIKEAALLGLDDEGEEERAHVNLRYYRPEHQCFSTWRPEELAAFSAFCTKLTRMTWPEIYRTKGPLGVKTGVGYTVHSDTSKLPANPALKTLSQDLTWFELRVDKRARVHGFRVTGAFFLVFLDREHAVHAC